MSSEIPLPSEKYLLAAVLTDADVKQQPTPHLSVLGVRRLRLGGWCSLQEQNTSQPPAELISGATAKAAENDEGDPGAPPHDFWLASEHVQPEQ